MDMDIDKSSKEGMRLEAYPVKQTAYLSMTSIFIRRGNFAYDPVKGFLESPWPQGRASKGQHPRVCRVHGIYNTCSVYIYIYTLDISIYTTGSKLDIKETSS